MTFGLMRVKNEARWIERAIRSISGICDRVLMLDDHSTDDTPAIAARAGAEVIPTPHQTMDEARDKNTLYQAAGDRGLKVGDWVLMIDGDEELHPDNCNLVQKQMASGFPGAISFRVVYLWDREDQVRVDGIYARFRRPSLYRVNKLDMHYRATRFGANLHCSNAPVEAIGRGIFETDIRLLHYGYLDAATRARKHEFYNRVDPDNEVEDRYRHITQGDAGGAPADAVLKHAGPLRLARL